MRGRETLVQQITFSLKTLTQWLVLLGLAIKEKILTKSQRKENSPLLRFILHLIKSMEVELSMEELDCPAPCKTRIMDSHSLTRVGKTIPFQYHHLSQMLEMISSNSKC